MFIKNNFKYLFIFIYSVSVLVFFACTKNSIDAIWNYGFSFAIAHGQVPYRDFTMIIPPLYNFLMSIGLLIWDNNLVFLIEQSILITICFAVIYQRYQQRAWLFLAMLCIPFFSAFIPTYNFFLFFLVVLILSFEKQEGNDYVIGFLIACTLLTKHTVGFFFILPSLILYFGNWKKIGKRAIACFITCSFFFIYLLCTNSFNAFIDLCFLGLFDFASSNSVILTPYFYISIVILLGNIFVVKRHFNNPVGWYCLFSFSILFPIFTHPHFYTYLLFFSLLLMEFLPVFKIEKALPFLCVFSCFVAVIFNFFLSGVYKKIERIKDIHHFEYMYIYNGKQNDIQNLNKIYHKYQKFGNTKLLFTNTVFMQIINEEKLNYFSILNRGNYGYNGTAKMIEKIKKMKSTYFIIDMNEYNFSKKRYTYHYEISQFDYKIIDYIIEKSAKIDSFGVFSVYYMK